MGTVGLALIPVLAGWSAVRVWAGGRRRDDVSAFFWSAVAIGIGLGGGPWWLLAGGAVAAGATVLAHLVVAVGALLEKPLVEVDAEEFRARLLALCGADGPSDGMLIGVGPDGTVTVWGLEAAGVPRHRHRLRSGCAACLLEGLVDELADNGAEVVELYRVLWHRRANQLFLLRRAAISGRWTAELRPVQGFKVPFERLPCPVHRL